MSAPFATTTVTLDRAELGAILAALRLLQRTAQVSREINSILTGCNEFEPLSVDQIDTLCERINTKAVDAEDARKAIEGAGA